ncbi:hypothetical protein HS088_TW19G00287 [Tripterygium wilfordii]|uniref:ETFB lysine methyltransferase n=1 Tax=Tripterygium wilfordii TaxID=458696 RepID=A0A7J7C980_TRIWF|nr:ribosomal protein L11 methyltransferase [Tripterygium wilfordii]KAF5730693.1 hypothetical protein HS088_TW19G00287 [Tripterygium wilfordii]
MSVGNFCKQFFYNLPTLQRRLLHSLPSALANFQLRHQWKPISAFSMQPIFVRSFSRQTSVTASQAPNADADYSGYLSVRVRCPKHAADELSEALLCFGASSTSMDEDDNREKTDQIYIDSIFPESQDVAIRMSQAADSIGLKEVPSYEVKLGEKDYWVKTIQESFHPINIIDGLWIVPEWMTPPDVQATNIILNPGLAFGTGDHPTTQLCLLLLKSFIKGGEVFLDYGTGSGILAIAALKFGAALSVGVDIDPKAIISARENAVLNDIGPEKMKLHLIPSETSPSINQGAHRFVRDPSLYGEVISETEKYDVVIANILLNPLLDLADHIASYAKPGATVGVSGILTEQVPLIMDRYSQFLEDMSVSEIDDWACVSGTKKRSPTDSC